MRKQLARWKSFAAVAKEVYFIGPKSNPYWMQWEAYLTENNFSTSFHHWCVLGVRDSDTRKAPVRHTRISSTRSMVDTPCNCGDPSSHVFQLRVERRPGEADRGESAP